MFFTMRQSQATAIAQSFTQHRGNLSLLYSRLRDLRARSLAQPDSALRTTSECVFHAISNQFEMPLYDREHNADILLIAELIQRTLIATPELTGEEATSLMNPEQ